ncbi:MAG: MBL fold metallo-hydrolase [Bacteroidales bacterium]|nr:MBL fold metallo-hydrolase [Bacteroidales bacterium]
MADKSYRILRIPVLNVSCYLIYNETGAILVDTCNRGSGEKVMEMLGHLKLETASLKLIIITHSHYDHAGSAAEIRKLTGAPVAVHRNDADELRNGYGPLPDGTRWKARILVALGRTFLKRLGNIPPLEPDIIVEDQFELDRFGFKGRILHLPGHTDGSVVVCLDGGDVIAGDTVFGIRGHEIFPPFADDRMALLESWEKLLGLPFDYLYPGHGARIPKRALLDEYPSARARYGKQD